MKKVIILSLLFLAPLAFFILLSLGTVNFKSCEIFEKNVTDPISLNRESVSFGDRISVLMFLGKKPLLKETQIFNLSEIVFKKLAKYKKFQMVSLYDTSDSLDIKFLRKKLLITSNDKLFHKWKFVSLDSLGMAIIFQSLRTEQRLLNADFSCDHAFIIDKYNNQRGRKNEKKNESLMSYDMLSIHELRTKLLIDTQNVIYEQEISGSSISRKERLKKK